MKAFALLPACALAACAATLPPPNPTGTLTAGFGQTAAVGSLLVTPVALVEDSRCPVIAQCVWAGRLVVKAEVRTGRKIDIRDFTLASPQSAAGGTVTLVDAKPEKMSGAPPQISDYRFTFQFSGSR